MSDDTTRSLLAHILIVLPNVDKLLHQTEKVLTASDAGVSDELRAALKDMRGTYTELKASLEAAKDDVEACVPTRRKSSPYLNGHAV